MVIEHKGAHACVVRVGRRGGLLTRERAPQDGITPLCAAAHGGHLGVVQVLVQAEADKDAPSKVRERTGEDVGRTVGGCFCVLLGAAATLLTDSVLPMVCGPCTD